MLFEQLCKMCPTETGGFCRFIQIKFFQPVIFNIFLRLFDFILALINTPVDQKCHDIFHFLLVIKDRKNSYVLINCYCIQILNAISLCNVFQRYFYTMKKYGFTLKSTLYRSKM